MGKTTAPKMFPYPTPYGQQPQSQAVTGTQPMPYITPSSTAASFDPSAYTMSPANPAPTDVSGTSGSSGSPVAGGGGMLSQSPIRANRIQQLPFFGQIS